MTNVKKKNVGFFFYLVRLPSGKPTNPWCAAPGDDGSGPEAADSPGEEDRIHSRRIGRRLAASTTFLLLFLALMLAATRDRPELRLSQDRPPPEWSTATTPPGISRSLRRTSNSSSLLREIFKTSSYLGKQTAGIQDTLRSTTVSSSSSSFLFFKKNL